MSYSHMKRGNRLNRISIIHVVHAPMFGALTRKHHAINFNTCAQEVGIMCNNIYLHKLFRSRLFI